MPMERALLLLRAASEGQPAVEQWTVGQVNARLLELRALLFGRELECLCDCPRCDAIAATRIDVQGMLSAASAPPEVPSDPPELKIGDARMAVRLPTAGDLIALGRQSQASGSQLAARLVDSADGDANSTAPAQFADEVAALVARRDPLAYIELVVDCPACAHRWTIPFYAIDILWTEILALADQLIHEVAQLARAFGWREADILQMSAARRRRYLDLLPP